MTFLTCSWCGYIYPTSKKAECPYCGSKHSEQPRRNGKEENQKDKKGPLPRCA